MVVILAVEIDFHVFFFQRLQSCVQIIHATVDHETGVAGIKVFRVMGEDRPHGHAFLLRVLRIAPFKCCIRAVGRALDSQMLFVPVIELLGILALEENAANARDTSHRTQSR